MFLRRHLGVADGIEPNMTYIASFKIRLASNAGDGCGGIGGSPGESVMIKAGATAIKPEPVLHDTTYRMNIDIGAQLFGGADASSAGTIANGTPCRHDAPYVSIERSHVHPNLVRASANGDLWLIVGTDSGFEGPTSLYYQRIDVTLTPAAK